MRLSRARLRASSAEVDYAIADLMPSVRASVSLDWTNPL
jgi:outer membrane protein TolC